MKTVVIIPTYNERENLASLLPKILEHDTLEVLVVDDNSPDGTGLVAKNHSSKRVHLLTGVKKGLGVAYARGMQHAVNKLDADVIVEMDADHSHDPADLPRLLAQISDGADFVIGSRYVHNGKITGWNPIRYMISWGGNIVARIIAGFTQVRDCTAGFRAIRADIIRNINWDALSTRGYGFQIRLLYEAKKQAATIREIPVVFRDRERGTSKLGMRDITEFFVTALQLGWWTYGRFIRFLIVGTTGFLINWTAFSILFSTTNLMEWVIIAAATETSILWNFFWHNKWTFRDRRQLSIHQRITRYHYTALGGLLITYVTYYALTRLTSFPELFSYPLAIAAATTWNFTISYFWAFKKS